MLYQNILLKFKMIFIKFIYILIIAIFLLCVIYHPVEAAQYTAKYDSKTFDTKTYPGYKSLIDSLQKIHSNWTFTILYTGLDWNQVIKNETTALHGRNLIWGTKTGDWICSKCGNKGYDNGNWKCASETTVSYYMDPRNSLFEEYIFQFENLKWIDGMYTVDGISKIISDCEYMKGSEIIYTNTDGKTGTIKKSYAQVIYDAAKKYKISPYHLAARLRQEQGPGESASSTATGTYTGYKGYYNFFNINAYGSGSSAIIKNALNYAKSKGWTDPEKSIYGGAEFIANDYINCGQSTLYLQKFDVDDSDGSLYYHQYMQNVSASKTEGAEILGTYKSVQGNLNFNFIIPVYKNMPATKCSQPGSQTITTQNIQVTDESIDVRQSKSTTATKITTLKKNAQVLRIEIGNTKTNGYYWDKVVLDNGTKGYIISSGIKVLSDITNCNIRAIAKEPGNVRNGPGTIDTTTITTLTVGQGVTIVEKGKYKNINGENWTRIYLSDGRQGYIVERYLEEMNNNNSTTSGKDTVKVVVESGLSVREYPGITQKRLTYLERGTLLTRVEQSVSRDNGYIWDKIITDDGIEGYVARGDSDGPYIEVVSIPSSNTTIKGSGFKTSGSNVICNPNITIENIKKVATNAIIKNTSGKEVKSGELGTGFTIKSGEKTYMVIKKGDTNGDGRLTPADSTVVLKSYVGSSKLTSAQKSAADTNGDGKLTPADSTVILRTYVGLTKINI